MISIVLLLMTSTINSVSLDCTNVIQLARGLGIQTAQPTIWSALQSDCCTASGIICGGNQRVTEIRWYGKGLNGTINGTAIPSSVTRLELYNNVITGSIPNALPSGLTRLWLYNNAITESIPDVLPSGLVTLYLDGNQMSGDIPSFPSTLQYLGLGWPGYPGNHFTGTVILNRPIDLYINDNWITDVVIQDSSVLATGGYLCDLSNNPLLGNLNIVGLNVCTKNGLYSAALLPTTRSTVITLAKMTTRSTSAVITSSISETTTKLGLFKKTTTLLETTDGTTTMEVTTNTVLGDTTAQQMLSSEMSAIGAQASSLTSILGTVTSVQKMSGFEVNLGMMVRCIICAMLLTYVMTKTPFKREFKKMRSKKNTRALETSSIKL